MTTRFSEEVCERLGNYVYRLIDPRNGETFYVGKGRNNRVFDHAEGLPQILDDDSQTLSCLIPGFDGAIFSTEWKEALWAKYVTAAPRRRTQFERQYSDRKLRRRN